MVGRVSRLWRATLLVSLAVSGCGRIGVELIPLGHGGGKPSDGNPPLALDGGAADGGDGSIDDGGPIASDLCNGMDAASYLIDDRCGVGYCRATNTPSSCLAGVESACVPGSPLGGSDPTCDGVDDDCDGKTDEDFPARSTTCSQQACAPSGAVTCIGGVEVDSCSRMIGTTDAACDGIDEDCDGRSDEDFVSSATTCGAGACAASGMLLCSNGTSIDTCAPGPSAASDVSCNGIDDDCNGGVDEDFVPTTTNCGLGVCARTGMLTCESGSATNSCVAGSPARADDPAPPNGLDDDCDGKIDEDACDTTPKTYGPGSYPNLADPDSSCKHVTVQLWGGGGASGGKSVSWSAGSGGRAGAGGYVTSLLTINGALTLYVGNGGANGCNAGGTNSGSANYAGGSGGTSNGNAGGDGVAAGGGSGGNASEGGDGGKGCYGGGGGGQGAQENPWDPPGGQGGGGGAASVLLMNNVLTLVAGGGGGSGGEAGGWWGTSAGGTGGDGCSVNGAVGTQAACGAAGGGGLCLGTTKHTGTAGVPFASASLPAGQAVGATDDCAAGGGGYAIVTFSL